MIALVTGGGGFLGTALVRRLAARGDAVRSYSRGEYPHLAGLGVRQFAGDLADADALTRAADGCDVIFHVAAKAGVWGPYREYFRPNVEGTRSVLAACRAAGVRRLVHTSTPSVVYHGGDIRGADESLPYPRRFESHYAATKALAEREVLAANGPGLSTVALRPHLIWGPGDPHLIPRVISRARAGKLRRVGRGDNLVDAVFVDDAAAAHVLAADRLAPGAACAGRAYFLGGPEPVKLWQFIDAVLAAAGLPPVRRSVSYPLAYAAGAALEAAYTLLGRRDEPPMTRFVARQLATSHYFDLSAARRDLGYEPAVSAEDGLRRVAASLRGAADNPAQTGS